jgi:hypothetical protein
MYLLADSSPAASKVLRVSLVNLQKFTLCACAAPPSMRMLAPAQNTFVLARPHHDDLDLGVLEAHALTMSASSISTPRS